MGIKVTSTALPEVKIIEPLVFTDTLGYSFESFNAEEFADRVARGAPFVLDQYSLSACGVLCGLHYQIQHPQGKLVQVLAGEVFAVTVDIRLSSPRFGNWVGVRLSAENRLQLWAPPGFAHGFVVLSKTAELLSKSTNYWLPEHERSLLWSDPGIGINWPINFLPILTARDEAGKRLYEAECYP